MIRLPERLRDEIRHHGERAFPHECCGFLVGEAEGEVRTILEVWPATNGREDSPRNRYVVPPQEIVRAEIECRKRGLAVVGYYHSHPDAPAEPSQFDRQHAWPGYSYVIVSVRAGETAELCCWTIADPEGPFVAEEISTGPKQTVKSAAR